MSEQDARDWIAAQHGDDAVARIGRFLDLVIDENSRQNLVAPSTIETIWQRHALDSVQLMRFDRPDTTWLDVGTGGGFPGMIVALLRPAPVVMIEPRKRRAQFLADCIATLDLPHARAIAIKVERWTEPAGVISARAVASIDALFAATRQCAGVHTRWILPKGRTAGADLDDARRSWRGMFHMEQSIVEPEAGIVIAERLERR
jgi:16S rRNA (guanine527-N7)-methyltransferase